MDKILLLIILLATLFLFAKVPTKESSYVLSSKIEPSYWFILHRKSNIEYLYSGVPGRINESKSIKTFKVKTGVRNQTPTPLPQILGREYWLIIDKQKENENPETAPYFLTLDIPASENWPFGPTPYLECSGPPNGEARQCNWNLPGYFGLHGTGGNAGKLSDEDPGSSGCIRHADRDITYLYNLLDPKNDKIKYYIYDI